MEKLNIYILEDEILAGTDIKSSSPTRRRGCVVCSALLLYYSNPLRRVYFPSRASRVLCWAYIHPAERADPRGDIIFDVKWGFKWLLYLRIVRTILYNICTAAAASSLEDKQEFGGEDVM